MYRIIYMQVNALIIKIDINVPMFKFKDSLKLFLLDNILTITYSK